MSILIQAEGLTVGYGRDAIVRDVDIEVRAGEFCALLGLNGCGKSTLLKTMCGLLPALDGRCLIEGQDIIALSERKRARLISYIPQRTSILEGITALDIVCMGFNPQLSLLEAVSTNARKQAITIMERVGVSELAGRNFSSLSEGQKQLVVLSRAMVQNTLVMMLDEPDSALDFSNRHRILDAIRSVSRQENKATLITLHDPNLALAYCDRLILLHQERLAGQIQPSRTEGEEIERILSHIYGELKVSSVEGCLYIWVK